MNETTLKRVLAKLRENGWIDAKASSFTPDELAALNDLVRREIVSYFPGDETFGDNRGRAFNLYRQLGGK